MGKIKGEIVESEPLQIEDFKRLLEVCPLTRNTGSNYIAECRSVRLLRVSDVLSLRWIDILCKDEICITEKKTGKTRLIRIGETNKKRIAELYKLLGSPDLELPIIKHPKKSTAYTDRQINRVLKTLKEEYSLPISRISTHTLRKTFGRWVYEKEGQSEAALVLLSKMFNHSSIAITRRYIGLSKEQIDDVYTSIDF